MEKLGTLIKATIQAISSGTVLLISYFVYKLKKDEQEKGKNTIEKKENREIEKRTKRVDKATKDIENKTHDDVRKGMEKDKWFRD